MKIRDFIVKLQNLPENQKKIVLWTIVAILAVVMGFFWVRGAINNLSKIGESAKTINLGSINLPSTDILPVTTPNNVK